MADLPDPTEEARIAGKKELAKQLGSDSLEDEAEREKAADAPGRPGGSSFERNAPDESTSSPKERDPVIDR